MPPKSTHVIKEISFKGTTHIWCICEQFDGTDEEYAQHKKEAEPLDVERVNAWKQMYGYKNRRSHTMPTVAVMREVDFLDELR